MLCKRFKEICDEQGWTVSDNGSDPIILCKQNRQGFTYSFPASHKNFVDIAFSMMKSAKNTTSSWNTAPMVTA